MKKKLFILLFMLTILSGCSSTPTPNAFPKPDYVEDIKK